jgi:hypothetical protein
MTRIDFKINHYAVEFIFILNRMNAINQSVIFFNLIYQMTTISLIDRGIQTWEQFEEYAAKYDIPNIQYINLHSNFLEYIALNTTNPRFKHLTKLDLSSNKVFLDFNRSIKWTD